MSLRDPSDVRVFLVLSRGGFEELERYELNPEQIAIGWRPCKWMVRADLIDGCGGETDVRAVLEVVER